MRRALEAGSIERLDESVRPDATRRRDASRPVHRHCRRPATPPTTSPSCSDDVCFCGDLILGKGSTIVPPAAGGGSLADYMRSLDAVAALDVELLAPGHGPWITDPAAKIAEYLEHRLERERRLIEALERGERSRAALLDRGLGRRPRAAAPRGGDRDAGAPREARGRGPLDPAELVD